MSHDEPVNEIGTILQKINEHICNDANVISCS